MQTPQRKHTDAAQTARVNKAASGAEQDRGSNVPECRWMRDDRARLTSERRRGVAGNSVLLLRRKSEREPAETGLALMIATAMRQI